MLPKLYPELAALADENEDLDFFRNVAHLQIHRRIRAVHRLAKVRKLDGFGLCLLLNTLVLDLKAFVHYSLLHCSP